MKYTKEITDLLLKLYATKKLGPKQLALELGAEMRKTDPTAQDPPERSIIAKLSTLGVYEKKKYLTKQGEPPVRKSEYIEKIAKVLEVDVEMLESLEKVTKNVLILILDNLEPLCDPQADHTDSTWP